QLLETDGQAVEDSVRAKRHFIHAITAAGVAVFPEYVERVSDVLRLLVGSSGKQALHRDDDAESPGCVIRGEVLDLLWFPVFKDLEVLPLQAVNEIVLVSCNC